MQTADGDLARLEAKVAALERQLEEVRKPAAELEPPTAPPLATAATQTMTTAELFDCRGACCHAEQVAAEQAGLRIERAQLAKERIALSQECDELHADRLELVQLLQAHSAAGVNPNATQRQLKRATDDLTRAITERDIVRQATQSVNHKLRSVSEELAAKQRALAGANATLALVEERERELQTAEQAFEARLARMKGADRQFEIEREALQAARQQLQAQQDNLDEDRRRFLNTITSPSEQEDSKLRALQLENHSLRQERRRLLDDLSPLQLAKQEIVDHSARQHAERQSLLAQVARDRRGLEKELAHLASTVNALELERAAILKRRSIRYSAAPPGVGRANQRDRQASGDIESPFGHPPEDASAAISHGSKLGAGNKTSALRGERRHGASHSASTKSSITSLFQGQVAASRKGHHLSVGREPG